MGVSLSQLEASERACRVVDGFEDGAVNSYIETLIRCGREYREWCFEDAKNGNHARAFIYHRMAEDNLYSVNWWMTRNEFYGAIQ